MQTEVQTFLTLKKSSKERKEVKFQDRVNSFKSGEKGEEENAMNAKKT